MLQVLVDWAVTTPLNAWVVNWNWTWVILEILHFFGLSMLFGVVGWIIGGGGLVAVFV
jgi:uncharacterized membrane protein